MNTTVRELGAQDASSPATKGVTDPPPAGTAQSWKPPMFAVNIIVFPSGDQSGSVQLSAPSVRNFVDNYYFGVSSTNTPRRFFAQAASLWPGSAGRDSP